MRTSASETCSPLISLSPLPFSPLLSLLIVTEKMDEMLSFFSDFLASSPFLYGLFSKRCIQRRLWCGVDVWPILQLPICQMTAVLSLKEVIINLSRQLRPIFKSEASYTNSTIFCQVSVQEKIRPYCRLCLHSTSHLQLYRWQGNKHAVDIKSTFLLLSEWFTLMFRKIETRDDKSFMCI